MVSILSCSDLFASAFAAGHPISSPHPSMLTWRKDFPLKKKTVSGRRWHVFVRTLTLAWWPTSLSGLEPSASIDCHTTNAELDICYRLPRPTSQGVKIMNELASRQTFSDAGSWLACHRLRDKKWMTTAVDGEKQTKQNKTTPLLHQIMKKPKTKQLAVIGRFAGVVLVLSLTCCRCSFQSSDICHLVCVGVRHLYV